MHYREAFQAALQDVADRRASEVLRAPLLSPDRAVGALAQRFDASWWSLMLFHGRPKRPAPLAWGRAATEPFRHATPHVAEYVARLGRPVLLDPRGSSGQVTGLLTRRDVGSAMAVPVAMRRGALGVLSLSVAAGLRRRYTSGDLADLVGLLAP